MRRRPPGQMRLLGAGAFMALGGWLPWLYTELGTVSGAVGLSRTLVLGVAPGLWVFYFALLAVAGSILPPRLRTAAAIQGLIAGVVGLVLPVWQAVQLLRLVGTAGWMPGPGLVMSAFGGILALMAARQLLKAEPAPVSSPGA
ncbi:hypothetical protein [Ornithinimicrobium pratense]|uniref:Uncharacterized protein n=1 Tax=Ornithinimicrobium pratense TaxID=2593973 RepID=A0A5J6V8E5_9MICO|nr:hypothetical protein [Ornithinimicrobium pratense]QFG69614.1 hypothetical protein FY030_13700 [Ornithinimicrobium pratense]